MEGYPKKITLRNGKKIELCPLEKRDEDALYQFFVKLPEADRLYLKNDVTDRKIVEGWCQKIDYKRIFPLLAFSGDRVVGDATLHMQEHGWSRHVGEIRCAIAKEFQRAGLGTVMVAELVQHANSLGLSKLETQFMSGQESAIKAFTRAGFKQEAILKGRVKDLKGEIHDKIIMTNDVEEIWQTMENLIMDMAHFEGRAGD